MYDPISLLFLIIFLFGLLYPQIQHKTLLGNRLALIKKLEKKRGTRVITMIHRQEKIGLFGIPFFKFIDIEDSEEILRAIRLTPKDVPIDLVLHTPGGLVLASTQIAKALKDHPAKTTVIIPHYAMSGGTLIALSADEIIMDPHAVLGPVDPQLADSEGGAVPAASILKTVEVKGPENVDDETLMKADVAEKAIAQVKQIVYELLEGKMDDEKREEIAEKLSRGHWTHDYPITLEEAKKMGLKISTDVPEEVYTLMSMYPQSLQRRPSVEFIPIPYQSPRGSNQS
ncbi:MAG: hypothetical protein DRQ06_00955 [Candidatus Hydrothermota bacterium]|uniref:Serine protease n=1 Tax=candidate division WOR-3 bacterium TaxID=2052148 RepID=A0A7C1BD36_UNCW3|nr:MAG: hypothetical protein DRQ06_00955 [Candidatus Hydrothermae bacterium]RKZ04763.1 MAG: hypothetical protein DRQ04_00545 [Candidatus Hydrothermae bacterium]HDM89809.1 hypothetical protein [candidate division WOR-3 bacterium]